jgi:cytochrome c6
VHTHGGQASFCDRSRAPRAQALEEYLDGGFNEAAVMRQVTNGKGAMPAFGGRLSDDDIANVATYVIATSGEQGWDDFFDGAVVGLQQSFGAPSAQAEVARRRRIEADVERLRRQRELVDEEQLQQSTAQDLALQRQASAE